MDNPNNQIENFIKVVGLIAGIITIVQYIISLF